MDVVLFGDQTVDPKQFLLKVLRRKGYPLLSSFFEQVQVALQDEITSLPSRSRRNLPPFSNIAELVERYYEADQPDIGIESTLTCLAQLSHFIGYFEDFPLEYPRIRSTHILGVCTGLLAASAVASSRSLSSLIPIAVQTIRVAFRLGSRVAIIGGQLESRTDKLQPWSTIVLGIGREDAESALSTFNTEHAQGLNHSNQLYISATSAASVTISGSPSLRSQMFDAPTFKDLQHRDIPIRGPYHASHLYSLSDVDKIINHDIACELQKYPVIHSLVGDTSKPASSLELFRRSVLDILTQEVQWDASVKACVTNVRSSAVTGLRILPMGPTALSNSLVSAFKVGGGLQISLVDGVSWFAHNTMPRSLNGDLKNAKIAIVGMAGRFPNAADHDAFWKLLEQGLDVHREVPSNRFDARAHYDPTGKGKNMSHTPFGCFIDNPGLFDPRFFNMSPREATQTDPMQRLALATAYEAMEMAGFVKDRTPSTKAHRIGTYYGQTSDDWREINAAQDIDTYFITGGVRAFGPGRINYHFGFSGPSFSIDTACSSSFAAIQLACTSLRANECDTVFTGGMNVMTNPDIFSGLSKGQFLSKTGSCKTYDESADGYCRGDGVATLILKRLDDAIAEKDPILGIISGIATNHSAEAVSITHPHAGAQKFLFQKVMDEACVDARAVNYVEMHGTGTQAGDGVEMDSVSSVFAPPASTKRMRRADQPLFVGSVKSNVGHGEAVSGATALTKVLLMLQKNMIPPHCGIKTRINPLFPQDLSERQLNIARKPTAFPRPANGSRYVFINNFSAAGGNTAMLLEDAPVETALKADPRSNHVIVASAKSLSSFKQNLKRLSTWAASQSDADLPSLAYTTTARRSHYVYRLAFEAKNMQQVRDTLASASELSRIPISSSKKPSVAFAFTGQGSHYIGMGKKLYQDVPQFRNDIQDYDHIACSHGFPSFISLIDGTLEDMAYVSPVVTQLAICCSEIALANLWKSWGVTPSVVIGHSLGEYAALQVAGVLSVLDTILLVGHRAELLVSGCQIGSHAMLAVRGSIASIESLIAHIPVERACVNGPEEFVLSGTAENIERVREALSENGIKATKLNVPYAFHSAQVEPILEDFRAVAKTIAFDVPRIPVISTYLGDVVSKGGVFGGEYLARHCRDTVNFVGGIVSALQEGTISEETIWIEVGPHPVCSNMIKSIIGKKTIAVSTMNRNEDSWKTVASSLSSLFNAGVSIDWNEYHHDFDSSHRVLTIPSYAFDEKVYWIDYKENWTLTKGEKLQITSAKPTLSTTSIQKIVKEEIDKNSAIVIGQSDFAESALRSVIEGHQVNGAGLCPSTLYADMALTLCDYAWRTARPESGKAHVNVGNMETHKPLVFNVNKTNTSQLIQIEAKLDFVKGRGVINYKSVMANGTLVDQAQCDVTFEDSEAWSKDWDRRNFLVQTRIDMLKAGGKGIHQIQRGLAYKLFAVLVQYDDKFRGMEEVILNSEALEATASVAFQATKEDGNFFLSPYFIDSLCHITGFIMNANDAVDSYKQVYISHGWESLRFAKSIEADKRYRSYVRMQFVPGQGKMVAGDVYIFDGDEIVAVAGGVKFQCVPRTLLNTLLSPVSKAVSSRPAPIRTTGVITTNTKTNTSKALYTPATKTAPAEFKVTNKVKNTSKLQITTATSLITKALEIIASEVGCDMSELVDSIDLSDLGVDSLMSLSISGRFREELELDFASHTFNDLPTVADLKTHLRQFETVADSPASSGMSTPDMIQSDTSDSEYSDEFEVDELVEPTVKDLGKVSSADSDLVHIIRSTIAEEMGVELQEISDNTDLSTMGMDSLMSLSILGALREKTGLTMNSDLLVNNTSIDMIETSLGLREVKTRVIRKKPTSISVKATMTPTVSILTPSKKSRGLVPMSPTINIKMPSKQIMEGGMPITPTITITMPTEGAIDTSGYPPAQSILLQGSPKTATHILFLLPDGSGSATSYVTIPDISSKKLAVYGLNCPFMKTPEDFTIGVVGVCQIYMKEIQRRQPHGPYLLGGWSAGGVLAYEMTRQFIAINEKVEKLLLIDSPCPIHLEALPTTFHRFCAAIGLLGKEGQKVPVWLLPHFASAVRELTLFADSLGDASNIDHSKMPKTIAIWARDGIVTPENRKLLEWDENERMPNSMHWLSHDRRDLGPNGWNKLVGDNVECMGIDGNHFTMMRAPVTADLAAMLKKALEL